LIGAIERRLRAAVPLTPREELMLAHDLGEHAAEAELKRAQEPDGHLVSALWRRYALPGCNHYFFHVRAGLIGFDFNAVRSDQARLALTGRAIVAGFVAAEEAARAAAIDPGPPADDPFGYRKGRRSLVTPAQERFVDRAAGLGSVLTQTSLGAWAERHVEDALSLLEVARALREDTRDRARDGLLGALASGALLWMTAYGWKGGPLRALADAATAGGVWRKPRNASLSALEKEHPARPVVPLTRGDGPPASAVSSCTSLGREAPCPSLDPGEVPRGSDGTALPFVAQVRVDEGKALAGIAGGAALLILFQGREGAKVIALDANQVKARAKRAVPPGLTALRSGRAGKEPVSPQEARVLTPELFPGRQSPHDPETVLGRALEKQQGKLCTSSKLGGSYTPVQGTLAHPPGGRLRHLVFQLDLDDGAPLPDAGLTYVFAADGPEPYVVHDEHC
jgi:hypothetical protein